MLDPNADHLLDDGLYPVAEYLREILKTALRIEKMIKAEQAEKPAPARVVIKRRKPRRAS